VHVTVAGLKRLVAAAPHLISALVKARRGSRGSEIHHGFRGTQRGSIPVITLAEFLRLPLGFLFSQAVSLLELPSELLAVAFELLQVIIRELAPLLFDLALDLLPHASGPITIHNELLLSSCEGFDLIRKAWHRVPDEGVYHRQKAS
jgi:hypothetical protein